MGYCTRVIGRATMGQVAVTGSHHAVPHRAMPFACSGLPATLTAAGTWRQCPHPFPLLSILRCRSSSLVSLPVKSGRTRWPLAVVGPTEARMNRRQLTGHAPADAWTRLHSHGVRAHAVPMEEGVVETELACVHAVTTPDEARGHPCLGSRRNQCPRSAAEPSRPNHFHSLLFLVHRLLASHPRSRARTHVREVSEAAMQPAVTRRLLAVPLLLPAPSDAPPPYQ